MAKRKRKKRTQRTKGGKQSAGTAFLLLYQSAPAVALSAQRIENGVPVTRYRKELICKGKFYKAADDLAFEVTDDTLDHWVLSFARWTKNGNKIPVPLTHEDAPDPSRNRGWVVDMYREGDSLFGILDLIGEDADELSLASDVSIFTPPEMIDGKGQVYQWPITHVALCTDPVIPGLKGFEAIAASLAPNQNTENYIMDHMILAEMLGLTDVTPENAEEKITSAIAALKEKAAVAAELEDDQEKDEDEETIAAENEPADEEDEDEKDKTSIAASRRRRKADPVMVQLVTENRQMKLNELVALSKITPAVKAKLMSQYCNAKKLSLSLANGGNDGFDAVVTALRENNPVELAEKTGAQVIALSNSMSRSTGESIKNQADASFEKAKSQNPKVRRRV